MPTNNSMSRYSGGRRVLVNPSQVTSDGVPPLVLSPTPYQPKSPTAIFAELEQQRQEAAVAGSAAPAAAGTVAPTVATAAAGMLLSYDQDGVCPKCGATMAPARLYNGERVHYCVKCRVATPLATAQTS